MINQTTQSSELIPNNCRMMLPVAKLLHDGVDATFSTGDSNDVVSLFTPIMVLMLRGLEQLKLPLILEACDLEDESEQA